MLKFVIRFTHTNKSVRIIHTFDANLYLIKMVLFELENKSASFIVSYHYNLRCEQTESGWIEFNS